MPTATAANLNAVADETGQSKINVAGNYVGAADNNQTIHLAVTLNSRDQNGLDKFLKDLYTPGSSVFHHYLTASQFQTLYGPSDTARNAVINFLQSQNLQVSSNSKGFIVDATGSVAQVQQAFKISINNYRDSSGRVFYANAQTPAIPSNLAAYVKGVGGLSNNLHLHHAAINNNPTSTSKDTPTECSGASSSGSYTPNQFGPAYDFNPFYSHNISGSNQTVALFELADYDDTDISTYQNCFGLSTSTPISREIVNTPPNPVDNNKGQIEVELDMEVILGMVPQLNKMLVYESSLSAATDQTLIDEYNQIATDDAAQVVSTSWGDCELNSTSFLMNSENTIFQQMAAQGQSIFAAAGDDGSLDCYRDDTNKNALSVDDPGSQPYVTDVGGTTLQLSSNNYYTETVWSGSGGGLSNTWKQPFWQSGPGVSNAYTNGNREVPDVTIDGDPSTGYTIYFLGGWMTVGGTSAGAPMWASWALLTNQYLLANAQPQLGFVSPAIYQIFSNTANHANSPFHDIVSGTNNVHGGNVYPATAGYDLASGVGSPDAWQLAQNFLTYVEPTGFYVSPSQLNFTAVSGNPSPAGQTLNISYVGNGNFTWHAAYSQTWLNLSQTSGTLTKGVANSQDITATVNSTNLSAGVYTDTILFTSDGITETFSVPVTLTVQAAPTPTPTPTPPTTPTSPPNSGYTYYLPFLANNAGSFTTYLAIQNIGTAAANVSVQYYDSNGTNFNSDSCSNLAVNGECLPGNKFATNQQGAGIINSDQPLNVIVAEGTPYGGSAYAVAQGWATSLVAPLAINQAAGFSTQMAIFNGGSSAVTATVSFYDGATGNHINVADRILTIQPHTSQILDQTTSGSGLPTGFYGWAQIVGASNSQLVAQVLEQNPANHFVAIANAQTDPQPTLYAPAIFNGAFGGFVTGENIVNPNAVPVTVTINYQDASGTNLGSKIQTVAAHALLPLFDGGGSQTSNGDTGLPYQFYGSATVNATGGVVMVVNEIGSSLNNGSSESGTYSAVANGKSTVSLPVVANGGYGYVTGLTIQNTSNQTVNISVNYYDINGTAQSVNQNFSIAPHASQPIYQGAINLPNSFYGTAVINTTSGPSNALIVTTNALSPFDFYTYTEPIS